MAKNRCGQSGQLTLNWLYLKNELMELIEFLHAGTNSHKLKSDGKYLEWAWSKNRYSQSGDGTLKLNVSEEWIDGINWFLKQKGLKLVFRPCPDLQLMIKFASKKYPPNTKDLIAS